MRIFIKVILTFILFMVFVFIIGAMKDLGGISNGGPIFGTILFVGLIAAIRAVWKYKPDNERAIQITIDKQDLDKH